MHQPFYARHQGLFRHRAVLPLGGVITPVDLQPCPVFSILPPLHCHQENSDAIWRFIHGVCSQDIWFFPLDGAPVLGGRGPRRAALRCTRLRPGNLPSLATGPVFAVGSPVGAGVQQCFLYDGAVSTPALRLGVAVAGGGVGCELVPVWSVRGPAGPAIVLGAGCILFAVRSELACLRVPDVLFNH